MKTMDRYIVRELVIPFLAGSFTIALLFAANQLIFILKSFNVHNVPPMAMFLMIVYKMPFWLNMTIPAGISLAASLAITRLSRESEITAMRAAGVRVQRVILPIAIFGLLTGIGNYLLVEKVMPQTERKARKLQLDAAVATAAPAFTSNVWLNLNQYRATFGEVRREGEDTLSIKNVVLGERPDSKTVTFITAPSGTYRNGMWNFDNCLVWNLTTPPDGPKLTFLRGQSLQFKQPIFTNDIFDMSQQEPEDKTATELAAQIREGKAEGHDMTAEEIEYHERFSVPAACIVFAIIAPIFGVMFARSGSFAGVLLSFVLVLLYYNAYVISTDIIGKNHWLNPFWAAWLPNVLFLALGLIGIRRLE